MKDSRTKLVTSVITLLVVIGGFLAITNSNAASAAITSTTPCVPQDAYDEVVVLTPEIPPTEGTPAVPGTPGTPAVPAVTETINHPAVAPGPDLWWNWSPNDTKGPQDYEPAFPVDARGTWQGPRENGGPSQDTYGTFNQSNNGNGNSSWFHREKGTPGVDAYDEVIVITPAVPAVPGTPDIPAVPGIPAIPAVTETINHDAVVCPPTDEPTTPTDEPTVPTETPTTPTETPDVPTETPTTPTTPDETPSGTPEAPEEPSEPSEPSEPVITTTKSCLGDSLVVKVEEDGVQVSSSVSPSDRCAEEYFEKTGEPLKEEGF